MVGVDRTAGTAQILVDDATRPAVSADGNHVVYQRGDAVRVLSSDGAATTDEDIAELADAQPVGRLSISQHGRWLIFASAADLAAEPVDPAATPETPTDLQETPTDPPEVAPSVWAVDRRSSEVEVVDTTTTTTTRRHHDDSPDDASDRTSHHTAGHAHDDRRCRPADGAGDHRSGDADHPPIPEHRRLVPEGSGDHRPAALVVHHDLADVPASCLRGERDHLAGRVRADRRRRPDVARLRSR